MLSAIFSAKLQVIEYSATVPKFPELTGNFGESGRRLGVERWRYDALACRVDRRPELYFENRFTGHPLVIMGLESNQLSRGW
jgi:hypothetical protein